VCLIGQGGGRDRAIGYGVLLTCVGLCASRPCSNAVM